MRSLLHAGLTEKEGRAADPMHVLGEAVRGTPASKLVRVRAREHPKWHQQLRDSSRRHLQRWLGVAIVFGVGHSPQT
jgi:hypothetical protein